MTRIAEPPVEPVGLVEPVEVGDEDRSAGRSGRPRLVGIDLARGLAIIGMFGAHTLVTVELGWQPSTWAGVVHGRSSILFATLAGVSLALMSGGRRAVGGAALRDARTRVLVRAALLYALGAFLALFGTVAVILEVYAVLLVVALPFLRWSARRLLVLAGVLAVVGPLARSLVVLLVESQGVYPTGFLEIVLTGTYPGLVWIAFVLLGLGVGRLDLTSRLVRVRVVVAGLLLAVVGYAGGAVSAQATGLDGDQGYSGSDSWSSGSDSWSGSSSVDAVAEGVPGDTVDLSDSICYPEGGGYVYCEPSSWSEGADDEWSEDEWSEGEGEPALVRGLAMLVGAAPHSGTPFEVAGSGGVALLVIGLCLLAPRPVRRVLSPVAAAGTLALTLYTAHIVALSLGGAWVYERPAVFFGLLVLGALVLAVVWRRWFGQGPLERLVSSVSRRAAAPPAPSAHMRDD